MLIIVESPAKAKTISKIVGNKYTVKASVGHIRQISNDKKTKDGRKLEINGIDIEKDFLPIFEVDKDKKKVVKELKELAKKTDKILFATDEDREGEAISWHLAKVLNLDPDKIERLVFHEITKPALEKALKQTRPLDASLVSAQQARQVLDKLVGYKLSPVLWSVINNYKLSAGRVQSPALKIIVDREKEIQNFKPEEEWEVFGKFLTTDQNQPEILNILNIDENKIEIKKEIENEDFLKMTKSEGQKLPKVISNQEIVDKITTNLTNFYKFTVQDISQKTETIRPKPPFTTSTLQQIASSRLGMTPKAAMSAAQRLYEGVAINGEQTALITYMRTDSLNLSAESIEKARSFLKQKYPNFLPQNPNFYKAKSRNAQEAHEAIRPINPLLTPASLQGKIDNNLYRLYDLIWRRMVASQMSPEIRERYSFTLENEKKDAFSGSISWSVSLGFKAVWNPTSQVDFKPKDMTFKKGDQFYLKKAIKLQSFTTPPSRYSPASLIKKLEELGIGRPSTYASIISTLHDRQYVEENPKTLIPTILGINVSNLLSDNFEQVTSSKMTADLEENLDKVSRGELDYKKVLDDFWWSFKKEVETKQPKLKENSSQYKETLTDVEDPKFGDKMVLKFGRFGAYYQNPEHPEVMYPEDFREQEAKLEQAKKELGGDIPNCPNCEAKMELKAGRFGEYFQCLDIKEHRFPKNFREYNKVLEESQEKYSKETEGKKCEKCQKDLIVRVSKAKLNPYIACPEYKVGNGHTVTKVSDDKSKSKGAKKTIKTKGLKSRKFIKNK
jgi:DNA topoisomerase-1